jgi:hypothetical protein
MKQQLAALVLSAALVPAAGSAAEIIDRILAVVDGAIIMQSDVRVAMRLNLVPSAGAPDPASAVLERLIERQLILSEVDRYAPPDPAQADIDRHVADIRSRAGAEFESVLQLGGIGLVQLRRDVRVVLRIVAYLQLRFGSIQPTEEEILQYYRAHPDSFSQGGAVRSFADAHDSARAALIVERRGETIREWLSGLRRRANVNVLPH